MGGQRWNWFRGNRYALKDDFKDDMGGQTSNNRCRQIPKTMGWCL